MASRSEITVVCSPGLETARADFSQVESAMSDRISDEEKGTGVGGGGTERVREGAQSQSTTTTLAAGTTGLESRESEKSNGFGSDEEEVQLDPWQVQFEPGESINPKNWGVKYRWYLTFASGLLCLNSTFSSSIPSGIADSLQRDFPLDAINPSVLSISLFVAGYVFGPIVWGPSSEIWGRRPIFLYPYIIYTALQVANALVNNLPGLLIIRFLSGVFASVPINNAGALLSDIWDGDRRGKAMSIFALAPFAGPSIGPIISGYIQVSGTSWRWVFWTTTIFAGLCTILVMFGIPETYPPIILAKKAKRLRKETGDERWYAPLEKIDTSFKGRVHSILYKPFVMLALEPMLATIVIYMSLAYGIMYLLFPAIPFVFVGNHGFSVAENGLVFLAVFAGGAICTAFFMLVVEPRYLRHVKKIAPKPVKPEKRLELAVLCSWSLVISMFWFGWTSGSEIHWISPVLALCLLGIAMLGLFVSLINYIVDVYLWSAASALAGATVVRSLFGAAFPLFASTLMENLGTQWGSTVVAFIALLLAPAPLVLMKFGPRIRARSRYSGNKLM